MFKMGKIYHHHRKLFNNVIKLKNNNYLKTIIKL